MSNFDTLADRIRDEAAQAARPGQMERLEAIAGEVEALRRGAKTLGHVVEQQGRMVLDATGMHHAIGEDGDGDWGAVWENLYDIRANALREAEGAIVAAAPPINSELLYDGREDPIQGAYVEGFKNAWQAISSLRTTPAHRRPPHDRPRRNENPMSEPCHCGQPVVYGYDGDPTHTRGMCKKCDAVRCDAYPGECRPNPTPTVREAGDEGIAAVLAAHEGWDGLGRGVIECEGCGWQSEQLGMEWNGRKDDRHRQHVAAALAPLIAEREAKAWDEAIQAVAWCLDNGEPSPAAALAYTHKNNPYRAALAPETPKGDA